jgi:hypothetical protein
VETRREGWFFFLGFLVLVFWVGGWVLALVRGTVLVFLDVSVSRAPCVDREGFCE